MKYVLDTNTIIYLFKDMGRVAEHFRALNSEEISIPAIVLYELELGILKSNNPTKRLHQLSILLQHIRVLPFTEREAYQAAQIRQKLEAAGTPIGAYDILIAATALARNAVLVTHNIKEFSRVENLKITDWF